MVDVGNDGDISNVITAHGVSFALEREERDWVTSLAQSGESGVNRGFSGSKPVSRRKVRRDILSYAITRENRSAVFLQIEVYERLTKDR